MRTPLFETCLAAVVVLLAIENVVAPSLRRHRLEHAASGIVSTASVAAVASWVLLGLLVGGVAWFLPERFGAREEPIASSRPRTGPVPCL